MMMGGSGAVGWIVPVMVILVGVALVATLVLTLTVAAPKKLHGGTRGLRRPRTPEQLAWERYARGELTKREYRQAVADALQDRYALGELDLYEYEARLERLFALPADGRDRPGLLKGMDDR